MFFLFARARTLVRSHPNHPARCPQSHFIGKGHMGWHTTDHLLVNRGFTSHVGYLGGSQSYKCGTNTKDDTCAANWAIQHDMWHNETPGFDIIPQIKYSTDFYAKYAVERIEQRNTSKPLWLHVAMQAMHGGAYRENVPSGEELPLNTGFRNDGYGNALRSLDLAIGNITAALKANNLWDNTLLFVIADNGGNSRRSHRALLSCMHRISHTHSPSPT